MPLTRRQKEVLDFIAGFSDKRGYAPSYEEIAEALQLNSVATVFKHVSSLEQKGYLKRDYNRSRSVEPTARYQKEARAAQKRSMEIPLEGRIAAGAPVEAFSTRETVSFADFAGDKDTYALQVRGDSMIEDHICDGDYVLLERTSQARNGDVVVALVGGSETTLKRFYREAGVVRLQPANAAMDPIVVPAADIQIQGRLLAVLRKYR